MLFGQLKEKHTDRIVIMTVTELISAGLKAMETIKFNGPTGGAIKSCFEDIKASPWNDIRGIIKRSL